MLQKLVDMLKELMEDKFYGKVELSFEAGKVVNIKKTESIKLS